VIVALLDHLWQSTLFCGVVWMIVQLFRSNSAALRHRLWLIASLKFLVPFAALYGLGALAGLPVDVGSQPLFVDEALRAAVPVVSPTSSLRVVPPDDAAAFMFFMICTWLAGASVIAAGWLAAWRAARVLVTGARTLPDAPHDARVTDADVEPAVAGSFRPVVLLPAGLLEKLTGSQMRAVLAHEREHIRRYDNLTANLQRLVETLFWFHPVVWWLGRRLIEERERACDEAVLEAGHAGADYAAGILEVCRHCIDRPRFRLPVSALSGNLTERIRRILAGARPAATGGAKAAALLSGTLAFAGIPLITGATEDSLRRHAILAADSRMLDAARFSVVAAGGAGSRPSVIANSREVIIRNSSLREMVALSFGMRLSQVQGGGEWLDIPRYDVHVATPGPVGDVEYFDPQSLRGLVTRVLAERFDVELYVNQHCQSPCGRPAPAAGKPSP